MTRFGARPGYSLMELMMVMSVAAVLMVVNVGWIHQTMKFASSMTQRQRHHQNLTRLAWALRDDVRQSDSMSIDGDKQLLLDWKNGTQLRHTISNTSLVIEKRAPEVTEAPVIMREVFKLAPGSTIRWDASELPEWISLVVYRANQIAAELPQDGDETRSLETGSVPIDFHVRVAPRRRAPTVISLDRANTQKEASK
jgi:prepilin-type N-terminal cleavage/methylation domain-containing protein